jgi:hypothetical protein
MHYIPGPDGKTPVETDLMTWAKWMESRQNMHLGDDTIEGVRISTVFLGLYHSFGGNVPVLWETMVFGGDLDQEQERYSSWQEAERGHKEMVEKVTASLVKPDAIVASADPHDQPRTMSEAERKKWTLGEMEAHDG